MAIFKWRAEVGSSRQGEFVMFSSTFGDGYSQDIPNGINNEKQKWSVKVSGYGKPGTAYTEALAFIRAQRGVPFQWKHPNEPTIGWYKCNRYSDSDEGGNYMTLTMEFEQAYKP